jgi:PPM family protein phosphatase
MLRAVDTIALTDTGRQRRDNEDSMLARAPVFVVADGMGGAQAGEVASRIAIEAFERGLPDGGSPEERLAGRMQEANLTIHELAAAERDRAGMGTTTTAAYLDDAHLAIAHVGDSRAYLFRDDELTRLTQDHSLVEELRRQGKLTPEEAAEHPQRSIITRALGPEATVLVDTSSVAVRAGDVLLLCSDGLTSMISEARIAEILRTTSDLEQAGRQLIDDANEAGGRDNITVVLFRLEDVAGELSAVEAPTVVAPVASAVTESSSSPSESASSAPSSSPASSASPTQTATRPRSSNTSAPARRTAPAPLARTQGRPEEVRERRMPRFAKVLAGLAAALIVIFVIGGAGYLASRQLYFIGTNSQGIVTIFRGFPYQLPGGINLYETFYESGVPASVVPADRRSALFNHDLRSESSAETLVHDLELGQIAQ